MTIKTGHPQGVAVETILNNVKVYARLEQLRYTTATKVRGDSGDYCDKSKNREYAEDAESRLIGIERSIYDAIDNAFKTGFDLGNAGGETSNANLQS